MTKKLFWLAVAMLPLFFLSSCGGGDDTDIEKSKLRGTWVISEAMGDKSDLEITFHNDYYFTMDYTIHGGAAGNPAGVNVTERGIYEFKGKQIVLNSSTYNTVYYAKIKSESDTSIDVEVNMGDEKYSVTAKKGYTSMVVKEVGVWEITHIEGEPVKNIELAFEEDGTFSFSNFPEVGKAMNGNYKFEPFYFILDYNEKEKAYLFINQMKDNECVLTFNTKIDPTGGRIIEGKRIR